MLGLCAGEILLHDFETTPNPEVAESARAIGELQRDLGRW
jgi:hypothetical protein